MVRAWLGFACAVIAVGCDGDARSVIPPVEAPPDGAPVERATEQIPATGGRLAIDGFDLRIPPGSLLQATVITISKIDEVAPEYLGVGVSNTYRIEPADLRLLAPIVARVQLIKLVTGPTIWTHTADGYEPAESTYDSGHATAEILHAGSIFVGTGAADLSISPATLDLGNVNMGTVAELAVTVENHGGSTVTEAACQLAGPDAGDFVIARSTCFRIAPDATCYWYVRASARTLGPLAATLTCGGTQAVAGTVALTMTSQPGLDSVVSPHALEFGEVTVGSASELLAVTIANVGTAPLGVPEVVVESTGASAVDDIFTLEENQCTAPIAAGASCVLLVRARPTLAAVQRGRIMLDATPGGHSMVTLDVHGIAP